MSDISQYTMQHASSVCDMRVYQETIEHSTARRSLDSPGSKCQPTPCVCNAQVPAQQQQQPQRPPQRQPQRQSFGIRLEPVPATEAVKTPELHVNGFRNKTVRPRATRLTLDSESSC
jgi:hypothetical protein